MKLKISVLISAWLLCAAALGQSITLDNAARVQALIDLAYEAHGGEGNLDELLKGSNTWSID